MAYQKLFIVLLSLLLISVYNTDAFIPSRGAKRESCTSSTTELCMGLFDSFNKPKPKKEKKGDSSFLEGRGARITIRQDEDNAMWIEEPKPKATSKKPVPKKK